MHVNAGMLLLFVTACCAQGLRFGVKAGVPLTPYFDTGGTATSDYSAATRRYTFGPAIEWRAASGLGVAFDVLLKRTGYVAIVQSDATRSALDSKGDSWDFSVFAKYRSARRLFAAAGPAIRYIGPIRARGETVTGGVTTPVDTTDLPELGTRTYAGAAFAMGLEIGSGRLRLAPEFRFVRWISNIRVPGDVLRFAPNQAELLVGVLF